VIVYAEFAIDEIKPPEIMYLHVVYNSFHKKFNCLS